MCKNILIEKYFTHNKDIINSLYKNDLLKSSKLIHKKRKPTDLSALNTPNVAYISLKSVYCAQFIIPAKHIYWAMTVLQ